MGDEQTVGAKIRGAAIELFAHNASKNVSVAQICRRAGFENGSFYYAIPSKRALVAELYAEALQRRDGVVATAFAASPADAQTAITTAVRGLATFMTSTDPQARHLWNLRDARTDDPQADPDGMTGFTVMVETWLRQPLAKQLAVQTPFIVAALLLSSARALAELAQRAAVTTEMIDQLSDRVWAALRAEPAIPARANRSRSVKSSREAESDLFDQEHQ
jgi:AcrR family transcriptional regulator